MNGCLPRPLAQPGLALALGAIALPATAQPDGRMGGMWQGSWGWGHMVGGGLVMLLFWGGVIALVVLLIRWLAGRGREDRLLSSPPPATALGILEERFARGEIGQEEFAERRRALLAGRTDMTPPRASAPDSPPNSPQVHP